jgi:hypothetical protein
MANEFIIREGFKTLGDTIITGSLIVTGNISASIQTASIAISSSYSQFANTASLVNNILSSSYSDFALSSSYAIKTDNSLSYPTNSYVSTFISGGISTAAAASAGGLGYISPIAVIGYQTPITLLDRTTAPTANTLYATPIVIPRTCTTRRMGITALVSAVPTASFLMGIYDTSNLFLPNNLLTSTQVLFTTLNFRYFSDASFSSPITLQQNEVYWLAFMCIENAVNATYSTINWLNNASFPFLFSPFNRMFNPLLGVSQPTLTNSLKQLAYYRYSIASTGSMPISLPQTISSITPLSYGVKIGSGGGSMSIPVGASLNVTY